MEEARERESTADTMPEAEKAEAARAHSYATRAAMGALGDHYEMHPEDRPKSQERDRERQVS